MCVIMETKIIEEFRYNIYSLLSEYVVTKDDEKDAIELLCEVIVQVIKDEN